MNPFFFGPADSPLYGVYTPAHPGPTAPSRAVLLCYPLGSEYMRAHRAFRQLNSLLNRAGLHVLRFDYSCTGDSAGAGVDGSLSRWLDDIDWAVDELKDTAMVQRVSVVGLRWGASLAAMAACRRDDVDDLLLWDPIVDGRTYLDHALGPARSTALVGLEGFPLSPALVRELDAVDLTRGLVNLRARETTIVVACDLEEYHRLDQALSPPGTPSRLLHVPSSGDWGHADPFGDALIPQKIIQAVVHRLGPGSPS